ncbi:MAG: PilN domain-containing protein [Patescibacteria group bacterium]|nr:PilN domain-containing protein [Patescibacteria group bacterium]
MQDINLIPEELKRQKRREIQIKGLFKWSIVLCSLSIIVSVGLLAYKLVLNKTLNGTNEEIVVEEQKIVSLKDMESKMTILGEKLTFIQKVLDSRLLYSKLLKELGKISPSGVYLTDIAVSGPDKATIGGVTASYAMLSELVKNIADNSLLGESIFDYSEVTSVNLREETARIEFSMNIYLKKGVLADGVDN